MWWIVSLVYLVLCTYNIWYFVWPSLYITTSYLSNQSKILIKPWNKNSNLLDTKTEKSLRNSKSWSHKTMLLYMTHRSVPLWLIVLQTFIKLFQQFTDLIQNLNTIFQNMSSALPVAQVALKTRMKGIFVTTICMAKFLDC